MSYLVDLAVVGLVLVIVITILRAVRQARATLASAGEAIPLNRLGAAERVIERLQGLDVRCPRCGHDTYILPGSETRYRCQNDRCRTEVEGPPHFPSENSK